MFSDGQGVGTAGMGTGLILRNFTDLPGRALANQNRHWSKAWRLVLETLC